MATQPSPEIPADLPIDAPVPTPTDPIPPSPSDPVTNDIGGVQGSEDGVAGDPWIEGP